MSSIFPSNSEADGLEIRILENLEEMFLQYRMDRFYTRVTCRERVQDRIALQTSTYYIYTFIKEHDQYNDGYIV